jgi:hypothetical protein
VFIFVYIFTELINSRVASYRIKDVPNKIKSRNIKTSNAPSEITSLNQKAIELIKDNSPKIKKYPALEKPCIVRT